MSSVTLAVLLAIVGLIIYVVMAYNRLLRLKHNVQVAWSHIDILLKQRHDELQELVTVCREYMKVEQETLKKVALAQSRVSEAMQVADMAELGEAELVMANTLGHLYALAEHYPDLKYQESFTRLQSRINSLENALADRREYYNGSVSIHNTVVDEYPTSIVAGLFSFAQIEPFTIDGDERSDFNLEQLFAA